MCHRIEKVDGNKVYVASPQTPCGDRPMNALVSVDDDVTRAEVYVDGTFWRTTTLLEPQSVVATRMSQAAQAQYETLKGSQKKFLDEQNYLKGKQTALFMTSPTYMAQVRKQAAKIQESFVPENYLKNLQASDGPNADLFRTYGDTAAGGTQPEMRGAGILASNERFYIFISHSVPADLLRRYARQAGRVADQNVIFVLRGFINGATKLKPTYDFIKSVLQRNPECVQTGERTCELHPVKLQVDPLVYSKFNVDQVPAFAFDSNVEKDNTLQIGLDDQPRPSLEDPVVVYGDVSLDYAAEELAAQTGSETLLALADAFRHPEDSPRTNK